jgi:hypothetical protein
MNETTRYKILINARNFHYDNFNKWMTFYYIAIGALFVGFNSLKDSDNIVIKGTVLFMGLLVSIFWHWSCKGYYFWITNYIQLIKKSEENIEGNKRVYFCIANSKLNNNYFHILSGANISTSKITLLFSFSTAISWCVVLINFIIPHIEKYVPYPERLYIIYLFGILLVVAFMILIPFIFLESDISDFPDLGIVFNKDKKSCQVIE